MEYLSIKKFRADAVMPERATQGSAGYDLCACLDDSVIIPARGRALIPTGIAAAVPEGVAALIFGRSGFGVRYGITPANAVGVIDSDYRGEIMVGLANHSDEDYTVTPGMRIAQMVLVPIYTPELLLCEELDETARGAGGFGSTGA